MSETDSPYGHDYPVLDALADWVSACDPFVMPLPSDEITDEMLIGLAKAARKLSAAIVDLTPYPSQVRPGDKGWEAANNLWELGYNTRRNMRDLSAQFLTDDYTDSNTDEPCDVEWNVTGLVMLVHPDYVRPDEVRPGYVGYLIDKGPEEDQE